MCLSKQDNLNFIVQLLCEQVENVLLIYVLTYVTGTERKQSQILYNLERIGTSIANFLSFLGKGHSKAALIIINTKTIKSEMNICLDNRVICLQVHRNLQIQDFRQKGLFFTLSAYDKHNWFKYLCSSKLSLRFNAMLRGWIFESSTLTVG